LSSLFVRSTVVLALYLMAVAGHMGEGLRPPHVALLVDDRLHADYLCIGIDGRVDVVLVHECIQEIGALPGHLHQWDCQLAVMDTGTGNGEGNRDAEVIGCDVGLVPYGYSLIIPKGGYIIYTQKAITSENKAKSSQSYGPGICKGDVNDDYAYLCIKRFSKTYFTIGSKIIKLYLTNVKLWPTM